MKLQRSTGILLGVAIVLVSSVAIFETQKGTQPNPGETLYNFSEADVSAFTLEHQDDTLTFTKTDDAWRMTEPEDTAADPSSIAFLLNMITSDTIKETIATTPDQLDTYGLDDPVATVQLTVDDASYTLNVGDEDFSGTSLYVMTTQDVAASDAVDIYVISKGLENGINRPIADWIAADEAPSPDADGVPQTEQPEDSPEDSPEANDASEPATPSTEN